MTEIVDTECAPAQFLVAVEAKKVLDVCKTVNARAAKRHPIFDRSIEILIPEVRPFSFHVESDRVECSHAVLQVVVICLDPFIRAGNAAQKGLGIVWMLLEPALIAETDIRRHV